MSTTLLSVLVVIPASTVVVAVFLVLWFERRTPRQTAVAIICGWVLAGWAATVALLAVRGWFQPATTESAPPMGGVLAIAFAVLWLSLALSPTLRSLLTNHPRLIRLHVWRLEGLVFLLLAITGQVPALWAVPAGTGDFLIGATAFWVARDVHTEQGRRRAIRFTILGMIDLVIAISLGITTNPGALHVFDVTPQAELLTQFPLAMVPAFLVPLAFTIHIVTLWQLVGWPWVAHRPAAA